MKINKKNLEIKFFMDGGKTADLRME